MMGNGFDISLGLKTRYKDFYEFIENEGLNSNGDNKILTNIKDSRELWSDLEIQLGKYTEIIEKDRQKLEEFCENKQQINSILKEYLLIQQNRIDQENYTVINKFKSQFMSDIVRFYNKFPPQDKKDIKQVIGSVNVNYSIISFNYTNVISKALEDNKSSDIKKLIYVHGTLEGKDLVLGVNDVDQINNKFFKDD